MFAVPFHKGLANIVRDAKVVETPKEGRLLVLPHTIETTRLARNFDFRVPSPIMSQYDWERTTPFRTQRLTAAMLTMHPRAYVLSQMGTGKTRAALYAASYLMRTGRARRTIVCAPLSTLATTWEYEALRYFPHLSVGTVYGDRKKRERVLNADHDLYVINHHGLLVMRDALCQRLDIDVVVLDELGTYANQRTDLWEATNDFISGRPYVWGMTGSPTPNAPTDAWAQVRLLTPSRVPKHFAGFRRLTMTKVSNFIWVPKPGWKEEVYEAMQPAVRFTRDECVELPPVSYVDRSVPLSPRQRQVYDALVKNLRVMAANGEITAANEGVLSSKLVQIAGGWVYTRERNVVDLDPKPRLDVLMEVLDESANKVIVFADYIHVAHNVLNALAKRKYQTALVTGDTPKHVRDRIFSSFQNYETPRILVAHPRCMSHGLTLTAADTIVWYTPAGSPGTYEQACARITRPGQKNKQLVIHLTGTKIESKLYRRLQQKTALQGALLELFESENDA